MQGDIGRPAFTDEQYQTWLDEMRPFLEMGNSLYYATNMAGISPHYSVILRKYKVGDWFSLKVDAYRSKPGEIVNNAFVQLSQRAADRVKTDSPLSDNEFKALKFMAEKHRTSQPFFVNRTEEAKADESKLGKIIEALDDGTDYADMATEAEKQMVAAESSVQDQKQAGPVGDVQAESNAAQASSGPKESPQK